MSFHRPTGRSLPCETVQLHTREGAGGPHPAHVADSFPSTLFSTTRITRNMKSKITAFCSSPLQSGCSGRRAPAGTHGGRATLHPVSASGSCCLTSVSHSARCRQRLRRDLHARDALGEHSYTLLLAPAEVMHFCNAAAPPLPPPPPPLVSLFSINASQSLYNPCDNPARGRAGEALFFLTLTPTDPALG